MITVKGALPPAIFSLGGKTYTVSGSVWTEVPEGTTLDDIKWVDTRPPLPEAPKYLTRKFQSSRGKGEYYATVATDGFKECTCAGFTYRRFCRHTEELFAEIGVK